MKTESMLKESKFLMKRQKKFFLILISTIINIYNILKNGNIFSLHAHNFKCKIHSNYNLHIKNTISQIKIIYIIFTKRFWQKKLNLN